LRRGVLSLPMTKENARLIISQIIVDTLKDLKMSYPKVDAKRRRELQSMRRFLASKKENV